MTLTGNMGRWHGDSHPMVIRKAQDELARLEHALATMQRAIEQKRLEVEGLLEAERRYEEKHPRG